MLDAVTTYMNRYIHLPDNARVLVGVSGGVDSMVLLYILHAMGLDLGVAHVNYGMRGEASDGDEALVVAFCERLGSPCHVHRVIGRDEVHDGASFQERARGQRYTFFETIAQQHGYAYVAVGHHLDDQAETVLIKLLTGAGIEGISGMRPWRPLATGSDIMLIRPLLGQGRFAIQAYAEANQVPWREDGTNAGTAYRRNAVRHRVMPVLCEVFGDSVPRLLARTASMMQGYWDESLRPVLRARFEACCSLEYEQGLSIEALQRQPNVWQARIIMEAVYTWMPGTSVTINIVEAIQALLEAQPGRKAPFATGCVWRERDALVFLQDTDAPTSFASVALQPGEVVSVPGGVLEARRLQETPSNIKSTVSNRIVADASRLQFPLTLRPWQAGDCLVPLGMQGHKRVSDLLTDAKVPSHKRANMLVLLSGEVIVWVVGVRMADSIRVEDGTTEYIEFIYTISGSTNRSE